MTSEKDKKGLTKDPNQSFQSSVLLTEFTCKICQNKVLFNCNNKKSYLSKSEHEKFFGMQLTTYRIAHDSLEERHVNTVLVDHKGYFRGHIDAYRELLVKESYVVEAVLHRLSLEEGKPLNEHNYFEIFLFFDRTKLWVLDLICPTNIKPLDLARIILKEIEKAEKIYTEIPCRFSINIADKSLIIWIEETKVAAVAIKTNRINPSIELLIQKIMKFYIDHNKLIPNRRTFLIAINAITELNLTKDDFPSIERVLTDSRLFSKIHMKYPLQIPRIVTRLSHDFTIPNELVVPFLKGEISVIGLLESKYFKEILDMIDFIDRRNLLG